MTFEEVYKAALAEAEEYGMDVSRSIRMCHPDVPGMELELAEYEFQWMSEGAIHRRVQSFLIAAEQAKDYDLGNWQRLPDQEIFYVSGMLRS